MRKSLTAVFMALAPVAALTTLAPIAPVQAQQAEVSVSLFYDRLAEHGKWVEHDRWGWVWFPTDIEQDWRPYTRGRWVWTQDYGWYWASYEPFGWAVYHYGRWGYDERYGWVWVPGSRWAASWVAFRYGDRHIGWAPLSPDTLDATGAVRVDETIITADYYQPRWVFVETRDFVAPEIAAHVVPVERNVTFIRETRDVTNIAVQNNVFVNRAFEPQRIRGVVGRDIPTVRARRVTDVGRLDVQQYRRADIDTINVFNPRVRVSREQAPPERARARESDRPRVSVRPEAVRPEDRRGPGQRAPGAPPSGTDRGQQPTQPDAQQQQPDMQRRQQPAQPRTGEQQQEPRQQDQQRRQRTSPGAPPSGQTDRDRQQQEMQRNQQERRDMQRRERSTPGAPPSRQGTDTDRNLQQQPQRDQQRQQEQRDLQRRERSSPGAPPSGRDADIDRGRQQQQNLQRDMRQQQQNLQRDMRQRQQQQQNLQRDRRGSNLDQMRRDRASPGAPPSRNQQRGIQRREGTGRGR